MNVLGVHVSSEDLVTATMESEENQHINMEITAHGAMKLLGFLSLVHQSTGWKIPERLTDY